MKKLDRVAAMQPCAVRSGGEETMSETKSPADCICHQGSVCTPGCERFHHVGCSSAFPAEPSVAVERYVKATQKRDIAVEFIDFISRSGAAPAYVWEQMRFGARLWCVELGGTDDLDDLESRMATTFEPVNSPDLKTCPQCQSEMEIQQVCEHCGHREVADSLRTEEQIISDYLDEVLARPPAPPCDGSCQGMCDEHGESDEGPQSPEDAPDSSMDFMTGHSKERSDIFKDKIK